MVRLFDIFLVLVLLSAVSGRKRDRNFRDAPSLSYERTAEFTAAYRRAAESVRNNILPTDDCYTADGKAKKCLVSEFGNIAVGKTVTASSTCGTPPNRYCNRVASPMGGNLRQCYICDANHIERMNPANFLIDSNQKSCWVSQTFANSSALNEVVIKIALEKKYELTYIIMPFCNKLPESIALYKSADFGRNWVPLQYYSSNCMDMYRLEENGIILKSNEQAATCKNIYTNVRPYTNTRLAFSMVEGRPSAHDLENSAILRDWVTVTDIKVVFNRFSSPNELATDAEDNYYSLSELTLGGRCKCNGHASTCTVNAEDKTECECRHNTAGADCDRCRDFYFDRPWKLATNEDANECIACDCNLHSNKCIFSSTLYRQSGRKSGGVCINCRHNTAGVHCQTCKDGYFRDRSVPITHRMACKACECNLHSKRCVFSHDLYMLSSKLSGGVCIKCRHNTAGNKCHYCKEGYYRDYSKALSHRKVCKDCKCHPYGSRNKVCSATGQCNCKEGVTGQKCDRCMTGFSMTKEITSPCQSALQHASPDKKDGDKIPRNLVEESGVPDRRNTNQDQRSDSKSSQGCGSCRSHSNHLDQRKYCSSMFAIKALVQKRESLERGWVRFAILVQYVYKRGPHSSSRRVRRNTKYVYVKEADLHCKCPKLRINKAYLMIGANEGRGEKDGLTLDRDSIVVRYNSDYDKRVKYYKKEERRQSCLVYL